MIHRHLDYAQGTPPTELGPAAIDDLLDRGDLADWAPLAQVVVGEPWGSVAETILRVCDAHPMYGTSRLWTAYIGACRARCQGEAAASWPTRSPKVALADLRRARGLSQATVGVQLGM